MGFVIALSVSSAADGRSPSPSPSPSTDPTVIDADGLWLVAERPEVVRDFPDGCPVVLTPNLIEFARLQVR